MPVQQLKEYLNQAGVEYMCLSHPPAFSAQQLAHHVKIAEPRAMGRKVGDQWTVPLCGYHHRELHDAGNEGAWWERNNLDPIGEARKLWQQGA